MIGILTKIKGMDWKQIKTLTIQNCDPEGCRFERCPMHAGSSNPFPVCDQVEESGPGVLVIQCNQNPLLARALIAFADKVRRAKQKHGKA